MRESLFQKLLDAKIPALLAVLFNLSESQEAPSVHSKEGVSPKKQVSY